MVRSTQPNRGSRWLPRLIWPALAALLAFALPSVHAQTKAKAGKSTKKPAATSASSKSNKSKKKPVRRASSRSRGQAAPTSDRIREIQEALAREGFYKGEPNGKWDSATTESMRNFQQAQSLRATGKLDALTLQKLGLGSSVAGLAPPAQPTGSSN